MVVTSQPHMARVPWPFNTFIFCRRSVVLVVLEVDGRLLAAPGQTFTLHVTLMVGAMGRWRDPLEAARLYTLQSRCHICVSPGAHSYSFGPPPVCLFVSLRNVANNLSNKICTWNTRSYTTFRLCSCTPSAFLFNFFFGDSGGFRGIEVEVPERLQTSHLARKTYPVFGDKVR